MRDNAFSGWACTDCLFLLANGDTPDDLDEAGTAAYLASVAQQTEGTEVTLGMFREDHGCATNFTVTWHAPVGTRGTFLRGTVEVRADNGTDAANEAWFHHDTPAHMWVVRVQAHELETESDRGGECECEQLTFSSSACDVCRSHLAGARDAIVFWLKPEPATPEPGFHADPQETCAACAADSRISPEDHAGILAMAASLAAGRQGS